MDTWMVGWIDRYCTHVLHTSFCLQLVVELVRLQAGAGTKRLIQKVFHAAHSLSFTGLLFLIIISFQSRNMFIIPSLFRSSTWLQLSYNVTRSNRSNLKLYTMGRTTTESPEPSGTIRSNEAPTVPLSPHQNKNSRLVLKTDDCSWNVS